MASKDGQLEDRPGSRPSTVTELIELVLTDSPKFDTSSDSSHDGETEPEAAPIA